MPEHVVRLRPPAMPSRAFLFRQGMISNIANIYGFCLSRWREKGGEAVKHRIWSLASTAAGPKRGRKSIRLCKNEILYTSFLVAIIPLVLHLSFFFVSIMVSARQVAEQNRLKTQRYRARLAKKPRSWKVYMRKDRDRQRRARANFHVRVEAKLKEGKKSGVQAYTERLAKSHAAQTKLLRVRTVAQAQRLEGYKKQVVTECCLR